MNRGTKDQPRAVARFEPAANAAHRGMVTFELAIGLLTACLATALLGWGIGLVGLQARCTESAGQIARPFCAYHHFSHYLLQGAAGSGN